MRGGREQTYIDKDKKRKMKMMTPTTIQVSSEETKEEKEKAKHVQQTNDRLMCLLPEKKIRGFMRDYKKGED